MATRHNESLDPTVKPWYGVKEPRQRKRIQDRLAQRARRRRLAEAHSTPTNTSPSTHASSLECLPKAIRVEDVQHHDCIVEDHNQDGSCCEFSIWDRPGRILAYRSPSEPAHAGSKLVSLHNCSNNRLSLESLHFLSGARKQVACNRTAQELRTRPRLEGEPIDHVYLKSPTLDAKIALGVCGTILGISCGMHIAKSARQEYHVPIPLEPTPLQLTTPHYTWIDRLPFPRLRDNLILLACVINLHEFLADLFTMSAITISDSRYPWNPIVWSLSPGFREKWGYLFN